MSDWSSFPTVEADPWAQFPAAGPVEDKSFKSSILPLSRDAKGEVNFDIRAGIPGAIIDAFTLPGRALKGEIDIPKPSQMSRETGLEIANLASMGVAGPPVARNSAISAIEAARAYIASPDNALTGISKKAVDYARQTFDDPGKQAEFIRELQRLGPDATLADVSPEWMGIARGAASRPGQRDAIVQPLLDRDALRNDRLGADLDASLGPAPVPSTVEAGLKASRRALSPEYEGAFEGATRVDTAPLALQLDAMIVDLRGPARTAAQDVRSMLNLHNTEELDPSPRTLFEVRKAIDGMSKSTQDGNVQRVLGAARQHVDEMLAQAVPGIKDVDAKYAGLMKESEALERGGDVLGNGKNAIRPVELQEEMATLLPEARRRLQQGTRAEIDRVVGTSANDPASLQRLLKSEGDWGRDKMRVIFGEDSADTALNAVDRETQFYRTAGRVTAGSDTAMAQRFGNFLDEAATPNAIPKDTTATGLALRTGQKTVQKLLGANAEAKAERFASELGRLAVAQGRGRDDIVRSLQAAVAARRSTGAPVALLEDTIRLLSAPSAVAAAD